MAVPEKDGGNSIGSLHDAVIRKGVALVFAAVPENMSISREDDDEDDDAASGGSAASAVLRHAVSTRMTPAARTATSSGRGSLAFVLSPSEEEGERKTSTSTTTRSPGR